jgi:hypothetical protein
VGALVRSLDFIFAEKEEKKVTGFLTHYSIIAFFF